MTACLLALALAVGPAPRQLALYPLQHPEGRDAQAAALRQVVVEGLAARGLRVIEAPDDVFARCTTGGCLAPRAATAPGVAAVTASWARFGEGGLLTASVLDDREGKGTFELAVPAPTEAELPAAASLLTRELGDRLNLPAAGEVRVAEDAERPVFGLSLKAGNTVGSVAPDAPNVSGFNLRFSLEGDYLAAPELWPFVDVSLVLARDSSGNRVQLVPLLLGAKYVFRKGHAVRPFAGMALGLDFLSESLDRDTGSSTTFAVYGVGGVSWFVTQDVALLGEASLNLNGLEASSGAGVLFALGLNFGVAVLF